MLVAENSDLTKAPKLVFPRDPIPFSVPQVQPVGQFLMSRVTLLHDRCQSYIRLLMIVIFSLLQKEAHACVKLKILEKQTV